MSDADLAARISAHEHAFEGLLDLIPAKFYNPEDAANQWNKRKQTKEEAVQAKRAKLDPDQNGRQTSMQSVKKTDEATQTESGTNRKSSKKSIATKNAARPDSVPSTKANLTKKQKQQQQSQNKKSKAKPAGDVKDDLAIPNLNGAQEDDLQVDSPAAVDPATPAPPPRNITDLRAKLAAKIEALRSRRKAPGSGAEGAPTSRDAILEARRRKEEARRERKKLEKEARKDAELEIPDADDDNDNEPSDDDEEADDDVDEGNVDSVSFGRVSFADGDRLNADGTVKGSRKRKQQDPQSALQAALNKKARLAALPDDKRAKIADSDTWHKALLQADGEKVKDDVALLKRAVKRKESIKNKSSKEWKERLASIAKSKALKQKNREQNLKDRKDSKGQKGGHKKGKQIGAYQGKKKGKSGF